MSFTRKYLLWLLAPPAVISVPPALLFLWQVVQLTAGRALVLAVMLVVTYALGCLLFVVAVRPHAQASSLRWKQRAICRRSCRPASTGPRAFR